MLCNASARIQSVSAMSINVNCVEFINRIDWVLNIGKGVKRPGEEVLWYFASGGSISLI